MAAYLVGTLPTALLVGRRTGVDPTAVGSGNPGASNVYRTSGRRAGALVLAGDVVKGAVAAGAGLALGGRGIALACGAAAVLGHVAPLTRLRRGGKGVATAAGAVVVLFPLIALAAAAVWAIVVGITRRASVASLAAMAAGPLLALVAGLPARDVLGLGAIASLVVARHAPNIRRLLQGEEPVLGGGRT